MLYELTKLSGPLLKLATLSTNALTWMAGANAGRILGHWHSEIGELGAVLILCSFASYEALAAERQRHELSSDPFKGAGLLRAVQQESYQGFDFLPAIEPRAYGGLYEFRTYWLKPGGLPPTLAGGIGAGAGVHRAPGDQHGRARRPSTHFAPLGLRIHPAALRPAGEALCGRPVATQGGSRADRPGELPDRPGGRALAPLLARRRGETGLSAGWRRRGRGAGGSGVALPVGCPPGRTSWRWLRGGVR